MRDLNFRQLGASCLLATCYLSLAANLAWSDDYGLAQGTPASVGMLAERLQGVKEIVERGLSQKRMPGCVVCVGRKGKIVYH